MPLRSYYIFKKGPRAGKPLSRCMACERVSKGRDRESGLVPVDRVWFIFLELRARLGKVETCRQLGISPNLWSRVERHVYTNMYRKTAKAAMLLLRELREKDVSRHPDSIRHGALARGRKEKKPIKRYVDRQAIAEELAIENRKRWQDPKFRKKMDESRALEMHRFSHKKEKTT